MDGISFSVSQAALVTLSGVIGMIVQRILFGSGSSKDKSVPELACEKRREKNDAEHKIFYQKLEDLGRENVGVAVTLQNINSQLAKISRKLDV